MINLTLHLTLIPWQLGDKIRPQSRGFLVHLTRNTVKVIQSGQGLLRLIVSIIIPKGNKLIYKDPDT